MSAFDVTTGRVPRRGPNVLRRAADAVRTPTASGSLVGALLLLVLYAAFAHGAVQSPTEARLQVAVAAVAACAAAAWLWIGSLRVSAPRLAWVAFGLLAAFTLWSAISLFWSVAPNQTWIELNRGITYLLVLGLAICLGASEARAGEWLAIGFLGVTLAVSAYALGQKLVPGLHVAGVFNLNQTQVFARLQEPLGYWNALALFATMAVPLALVLLVDTTRSRSLRLVALVDLQLLFLVIAFTESRGGLLALAVALVAVIGLTQIRLRTLMWLGVAAAGSLPCLILGLKSYSLTTAGISLSHRETAGAKLSAVLAVSLAALVLAGWRLLPIEARTRLSPARARGIARALIALAGLAVLIGLVAIALSSRGFSGTISHAWHSFTATRGAAASNPSRLLSADSGNRWVWWKEALGAFSAKPLTGWGAGSFQVVHLLYRSNGLAVKQPHSVPLQWLAETGLIGTVLAMAGSVLLLAAALRVVRARPAGSERMIAAALFAAGAAYGMHSFYDWDSDFPAVTLPALLFLGVLVGSARVDSATVASVGIDGGLPTSVGLAGRVGRGAVIRIGAIAVLTFWLCCFAASAALPSIANDKAAAAEVDASGNTFAIARRAQSEAVEATRLDPLSDAGLRAEGAIAVHVGALPQARRLLLEAVRRQPSDGQAWETLSYIDVQLEDWHDAIAAAQRVVALDPRNGVTGGFVGLIAQRAQLVVAPPQESATATETPEGVTSTSSTTP